MLIVDSTPSLNIHQKVRDTSQNECYESDIFAYRGPQVNDRTKMEWLLLAISSEDLVNSCTRSEHLASFDRLCSVHAGFSYDISQKEMIDDTKCDDTEWYLVPSEDLREKSRQEHGT